MEEFNEDMDLLESIYGKDKGLMEFIKSLDDEKREKFIRELLEEEFE